MCEFNYEHDCNCQECRMDKMEHEVRKIREQKEKEKEVKTKYTICKNITCDNKRYISPKGRKFIRCLNHLTELQLREIIQEFEQLKAS